LLEASLTPVPNNRSALAIYNAKGQMLNASEVKQYLLSVERTETPITNNQEMKKELILALVALCAQAGHTIALSAESKDEDFAGAIKKVGEKITSLEQAKSELSAKVETFEKDAKTAAEKEIDDLLAQGVTDLKLTAAEVPAFKELGKINLSALKTTLSALKPVAVVTIQGAEDKSKETAGADDKTGWDYDKYALSAPNELAEMETKQPEKFKVLLSAKLDKVRNTYTIPA
jgi:phosphotransferase system HPr-like phosphotransfer protein